MISNQVIEQVVKTIAEECKPQRIILFGSCASGNVGHARDLDLLIIKETSLPPSRRSLEIQNCFRDNYPCAMDVVVYTPSEIEHWKDCKFSFVHRVLKTGKVMYG